MTITEKIKWVVLPAFLVIGIGILEINFPHAMDGFDDGYTGRGVAGFIVLLFELFICLTWGKVAGTIAILLGALAIVIGFLPKDEQPKGKPTASPTTNNDGNLTEPNLSSIAFRAGKTYIQRKLRNHQPYK